MTEVRGFTAVFGKDISYIAKMVWSASSGYSAHYYLGVEDTPYVRAVTRKAFTATVARAMEPGCKYDTMLILAGPQGIEKSTLLDKMSKGWFNDGIRTFEGKEASELLQGVWLVEISELDAFRKTDTARIKRIMLQIYESWDVRCPRLAHYHSTWPCHLH